MKVLVVDDEQPARSRLIRVLKQLEDWTVVGEAATGNEALSLCEAEKPDIVLMDIRMPGMDGIEAARHLSALEKPPAIIFTTAYNEYAMEAFDAQAVGYLLKPVRRERLARALRHAAKPTRAQLTAVAGASDTPQARAHICARERDTLKLIPVEDIIYFLADQKYTTVRYADGEVLIDEPLKALEEEFAESMLRIHRNALVAIDSIEGLAKAGDSGLEVVLRDCDARLAVSRRHAPEVRRKIRLAGAQ
ncbi:MAG: LytTR family DNA-binding domain-containing protein [Pseudomonadota bacterium]